ncbi:glycosyltransferase [Ancylobacter sp. FA202]|uniref:glycosyltransferase n=1 Tax=Ancylobacter sp. FA202 TaxID=1111106 RepID=UPI00039FD420|nr:glycosyltransferase [Ancylobacter sp. FA202]
MEDPWDDPLPARPMSKRCVLYLGGFYLYPPDAAGRRVLSIASLIAKEGFEVILYPSNMDAPEGTVFSASENYEAARDLSQLPHLAYVRLVARALRRRRPDAAIVYNPTSLLAATVWLVAQRTGTRCVLDVTEWYQYSHFGSLKWVLEIFVRMHLVYRLFARAICGSYYLAEHFGRKLSVVIPPLPSIGAVAGPHAPPLAPGPLRLVYAGFPGQHKDKIPETIQFLDEVAFATPFPIELHLAGPERSQIGDLMPRSGNFRLIAHGRLGREELRDLYALCHLSVLIRSNERYEWAGFPMKATESWASGVPVVVMSHSRFAQTATAYGASVVIDPQDPVGSLRNGLTTLYGNPDAYREKSTGALRLVEDRHSPETYRESIRRILL